jgi:hypothetical protein
MMRGVSTQRGGKKMSFVPGSELRITITPKGGQPGWKR